MGNIFNIQSIGGISISGAKNNAQMLASKMGLDAIEFDAYQDNQHNLLGYPMVFPLRIKKAIVAKKSTGFNDKEIVTDASGYWLFPNEPMISISGSNTLIRRFVAKRERIKGSIKEVWNTNDYEITIQGLLSNIDSEIYPSTQLKALIELSEHGLCEVLSPLLQMFGIGRIIIEKIDLPFTKGPENQNFTIGAYSDDNWDFLIPLNTQ